MAYFYVKSGGTATDDAGRETTMRTGAFEANANNFPNVQAVFATTGTAVAAGDFILCSDLSAHAYAASVTYGTAGLLWAVYVVSVDDANQEQYKAGAIEDLDGAGTYDLNISGYVVIEGLIIRVGDDIQPNIDSGVLFRHCTITMTNNLNTIGVGVAFDANVSFENTTISWTSGTTGPAITSRRGGITHMYGGTLDGGSGTIDSLFNNTSDGGGTGIFENVDMTDVTKIITGNGAGLDDNFYVVVKKCALNGSVTFADETFIKDGQYLLVMESCSGAGREYQFFQRTNGGDVQDNTTIYRDESEAFPSATKVRLKCTAVAATSIASPLYFDFPTQKIDLSSASTDTIRIYFASTTALTNTNCWAEVYYPDGTNTHVSNLATNRASDILAAGTAHTDDSGSSTWKDGAGDLAGYNEYRMDIATSGDVGAANSVPVIRVYLAAASAVVYFDTTIGVVA